MASIEYDIISYFELMRDVNENARGNKFVC